MGLAFAPNAMTLLRDIQDAAVSSNAPLSDLLRRCRILGTRLKSTEFTEWVDRELNGYPSRENLPAYRVTPTVSVGYFSGPGGRQASNIPIPSFRLPEPLRETWSNIYLDGPIRGYEDLIGNSNEVVFQCPWPGDLIAMIAPNILAGMYLVSAHQSLSRLAIIGLLDSVRNRVLNFALDIEAILPSDNVDPRDFSTMVPERVHQVFETHIHGNIGNYAAGSREFTQESGIAAGDLVGLRRALEGYGFADADVVDLERAIDEDKKTGVGMGPRVGAWLAGAFTKAGNGLVKLTFKTAATVLPKLIASHLGLPMT
jgi:AbiTii